MKFISKVRGKIPEMLGIPDQTLPGVPIIEIYGDSRVLIEGKSTVLQYGTTCIKLRNTCGTVSISGSCLCMAELSVEQMIITGRIDAVMIGRGSK